LTKKLPKHKQKSFQETAKQCWIKYLVHFHYPICISELDEMDTGSENEPIHFTIVCTCTWNFSISIRYEH